jgi:hypothetical protein
MPFVGKEIESLLLSARTRGIAGSFGVFRF